MRIAALALALLVASLTAAQAHTRSQSFSTWVADGNVLQGVYQVDAYRATQLSAEPQDLSALLRQHLQRTISLSQGSASCSLAPLRSIEAPRGDLRVELRFTCPEPIAESPPRLKVATFFDVSISHVHYVRVSLPGAINEAILVNGRNELTVSASGAAASGFGELFYLGFEHVLSGIDHLAFLIALAMLAGGPWRIAIAVTGFTLGHSLTLALVALNVLKPDTAAVEALIGFTVAWAAGDALARARKLPSFYGIVGAAAIVLLPFIAWIAGLPSLSWMVLAGTALFAAVMSYGRSLDAPYVAPAIATVFGLAHGAGFAGPLLEMHIPGDSLVWTLLAFNLGVEAGQLTALAAFGAAILLLRATVERVPEVAFDVTAASLFALGSFWFVSRALS